MPIKDFVCKDCEAVTELIVSTAEEKPELKCGKCGSENLEYKPGMFAHWGFGQGVNNPSGTSWGAAQRKYDGRD